MEYPTAGTMAREGAGSSLLSPARVTPAVRRLGRVWLTVPVLALLALLLPWKPAPGMAIEVGRGSDQTLHTATIDRIRSGEAYYTAVGDELRQRKFPTASPFNWRTPLLFTLLALNPLAARVVFIAIGLLVIACTVRALGSESILVVLAGAITQAGAIMVIFDPEVWVFHEVWTGYFVVLSLIAYTANRHVAGATLGLIALFVRELAAPYALLCLLFAVQARRRREIYLWIGGFMLYAAHYVRHVQAVLQHQHAYEPGHAAGWVQFNGLAFVADTLRTNSLLHTAPVWACSLAILVLAAGLLVPAIPFRTRATAGFYLAFFAVVGHPFNWYWGWMVGFVLPIVFAHGLASLWRISSAAALRSVPAAAGS